MSAASKVVAEVIDAVKVRLALFTIAVGVKSIGMVVFSGSKGTGVMAGWR